MKKLTVLFAGLFLMTIAVQNVKGQSEATAASSAQILTVLEIVNNVNLDFGDIGASATAGSVSIDNAGSRTGDGGAAPIGSNNGTAAKFTITGPANETVSISVDPSTFNVSNGSEDMSITLNVNDVNTAQNTTSTGSGTVELLFGGTIDVEANQAPGLYTNNAAFEVTVDYN